MDHIKRFDKGVALLKAEKYEAALKIFDELVKDFPKSAECISERGVVHYHMNNRNKALADLDKAVELEPQKSYRYSSRAYVRGHYRMTEEAIEDYKQAIAIDPDDAIAHNNLGLLEERMGHNTSAQNRFKIADSLKGEQSTGNQAQDKVKGEQIHPRNIQKEIDAEKDKSNIWLVLKSLTSKKGRDSFKRFLKSGFKDV